MSNQWKSIFAQNENYFVVSIKLAGMIIISQLYIHMTVFFFFSYVVSIHNKYFFFTCPNSKSTNHKSLSTTPLTFKNKGERKKNCFTNDFIEFICYLNLVLSPLFLCTCRHYIYNIENSQKGVSFHHQMNNVYVYLNFLHVNLHK